MQEIHYPAATIAIKIGVAICVGMIVGMVRGWSTKDLGVRTFSIVSLFGTLPSIIGLSLTEVSFCGVLVLVAAMNARIILADRLKLERR